MARRTTRHARVIKDREWSRFYRSVQHTGISLNAPYASDWYNLGNIQSPLQDMREATVLAIRGSWYWLRGDNFSTVMLGTMGAYVARQDAYADGSGFQAGTEAPFVTYSGDQTTQPAFPGIPDPVFIDQAFCAGTVSPPFQQAGVGNGVRAFDSSAKRIVERGHALRFGFQLTSGFDGDQTGQRSVSFRTGLAVSVLWGLK